MLLENCSPENRVALGGLTEVTTGNGCEDTAETVEECQARESARLCSSPRYLADVRPVRV